MENLKTASKTLPSLENVSLFGAMFTAMMSAFWAYEGWNNLGFMGGEIQKPHRNIPLGLMIGVGFVMLVYVCINFTYLYVLPIDKLIAVNSQKNTIAAIEVVKEFMGQGGVLFITALILMATFGSTNNTVMSAARIYFAMAQDKLFFKKAGVCHDDYKTPSNALLMQACWASVLVLSGTFDQLTDMLIFASFMFYGAGALGVFVLRRKMPDVPRPYKAFGYPVIPAFFILFCITLVVMSLIERPAECGVGLLLICSGLPFYWAWRKNESVEA
jgi:APA family basic amino acid/polyamine antiporter